VGLIVLEDLVGNMYPIREETVKMHLPVRESRVGSVAQLTKVGL
jgi:hypothetical protein